LQREKSNWDKTEGDGNCFYRAVSMFLTGANFTLMIKASIRRGGSKKRFDKYDQRGRRWTRELLKKYTSKVVQKK